MTDFFAEIPLVIYLLLGIIGVITVVRTISKNAKEKEEQEKKRVLDEQIQATKKAKAERDKQEQEERVKAQREANQKEHQKRIDDDEKEQIKKMEEILSRYPSDVPINEQIKNLIEYGNKEEGGEKGRHILEFNSIFNPYRDLVNRILSEKSVFYNRDLAIQLSDYIENNSANENYEYGIKDRKQFYQMVYNTDWKNLTQKVELCNEEYEQVCLEAFEYDLIINNETNQYRVSEIIQAITELNNIVNQEYPYLYKAVCEILRRDKNIFEIMQEKFLNNPNMLEMIELNDGNIGKMGMRLLGKLIELQDTDKFTNNTFYINLGVFDHTKPYDIVHKIGYDRIYINVALILFCEEKRDEILEIFYSRASQGVKVPEKAREAHTYIIGASKSGKSELIKDLIFSDFQKGNKSVILIEPHGDLAEQVARLKDKDNDNLVYIDFTLDPTKTPILNPFDLKDRTPENIEIQAQALIDAFEDILGSEFSTQMEELLGATIRTLMTTGKGDFWELRRFMDDENNSDLVTAGKASPNPKDRLFFNDGSFHQTSYKPTKSSLKSKIGTYLGYAVFRNFTTGKSTIDLKKLTDGKKWVIFNLSKGNIGKKVSPILGRFLIASLQNIILQRAKSEHRTPVYLYIDEFQNYTSETIEEIFSESRKYGFHLTVAHQNTGQLLGKMKDLVFSNTSVKIVGRNNTDQLKKLSNQILVEFEELDKLTLGNFYMRVEKNQAQPIKVGTKLIDNKYSMTAQEWEQVKAEQLSKYYTKIEEREPPQQEQTADPENDNFHFNPSDTAV